MKDWVSRPFCVLASLPAAYTRSTPVTPLFIREIMPRNAVSNLRSRD